MKKLQSKMFFWFYVYLSILATLRSTYVMEVIPIPMTLSRILTVAVYVPFVLAVGYKLFTDARDIKGAFKKVSNWIFYAFALYYLALCVYRYTNQMEVKENLYYSIIFFGAIAIFMLLQNGKLKLPKQELEKNLLWIAVFFIVYRLAYVLIGARFFERSPINVNLNTGVLALLLPFLGNQLTDLALSKKKTLVLWSVVVASIAVIATTGARALFLLTMVNVAAMLVIALIRRKGVLKMVTAIAAGVVIVVSLALMNVGEVRYNVYRQTGIDFSAIRNTFEVKKPTQATAATTPSAAPTQTPTEAPTAPAVTEKPTDAPIGQSPEQDKEAAKEQIHYSDRMRRHLVQFGIKKAKENPWFGNGDVMYWYQITEKYGFMQSAHNFLVEGIICYGIIGMTMIAALFISLLAEAKLFAKIALRRWNYTAALGLTALFYFAFGFVQPTVFDMFICPLFVLAVAACLNGLKEEQ
jgi:hypothetical protein